MKFHTIRRLIIEIPVLYLASLIVLFPQLSTAQNLTSDSGYEIIDPTINAGGNDDQSSTTSAYKLLESIGDTFNDERFESTNYKIGVGIGYTFMANVPTISYFETSDATMESVCGESGCYNRARFELGTENNPSDALYLIEITNDNWATTKYVDGSTHLPVTSKDINDYLTQSSWETGVWSGANIIGLIPNTEYKIRARALNGDFTESSAGPDATTTTVVPYIYLDINVAGETWAQEDPPHELELGDIGPTVTTSSSYIWVDIGTNAVSGATVNVRDEYEGLYNPITTALIDSLDENLATESDGYGLRINTSKWLPATGDPGYVREDPSFYNPAGSDWVGGMTNTPAVFMCTIDNSGEDCDTGTGTPVLGGRGAAWVKAKSTEDQSSGYYIDSVTFTAIGTW